MAGPNTATGAQPAGYDGAVAVPRAPSLPPGFSLRRCAPRDTARLVDVYTDAFTGGDFTYWWGPAAAMRAWNVERFRRRFRDPSEALFKVVVDGDGGDGGGGGERIVAHTRWVLPEGMAGKGLRVEPEGGGGVGEEVEMGEVGSGNEHPDVPEGVDVELYREFFDGVARAAEKWKASEKLGACTSKPSFMPCSSSPLPPSRHRPHLAIGSRPSRYLPGR